MPRFNSLIEELVYKALFERPYINHILDCNSRIALKVLEEKLVLLRQLLKKNYDVLPKDIYFQTLQYLGNNQIIKLKTDNILLIKDTLENKLGSNNERDLERIFELLNNPPLMISLLEQLDQALKQRAQHRLMPLTSLFRDYEEGRPLDHAKLLSQYFDTWAKENGFTGYVKLSKEVSADKFKRHLTDKRLFKDKVFRNTIHGEWTHTLQWWCIVEYHKQTRFLSCKPADLYAWLGGTDKNHWFNYFEVPPNSLTRGFKGFSLVVKFGQYMISEEAKKRLPILYQLIKGRDAKAAQEGQAERMEADFQMNGKRQ